MTNSSIQTSTQFHGKYNAIIDGQAIPCHNLATARTLVNRATTVSNSPRPIEDLLRVKCLGFCSPSGQHYAVVRVDRSPYIDTDVRIDCHNESTLRGWINNGIDHGTFISAQEQTRNVRSRGGWTG